MVKNSSMKNIKVLGLSIMKKGLSFLIGTIGGLFLYGCTVTPSEDAVREVIIDHYEKKHVRIIQLEISEIQSQPLSELKYMGTQGFHVPIRLLKVQVIDGKAYGGGYKPGDILTFENGILIIKEDPGKKGKWIITRISSNLSP